ncbi:hypothetical protein [Neptunomonas phycophila]|uniref:hypothetical protein n=1 Tax=Neptunomonas phycophila TaxID=1572645 RepID=UPI003516DE25
MRRQPLFVGVFIAVAYSSQASAVCTTCANTTAYGNSVTAEAGQATSEITSASAAIKAGFAQLEVTIDTVFSEISSAIRSMSGSVSSEIKRGTTAETKIMDEFNNQQETRLQAEYVLKTKQYVEENYGETNIPMSSCDDFKIAGDLMVAQSITKPQLRQAIDDFFTEYETAAPVDNWRYAARTLEFAETKDLDLNQDQLSNEELELAVEWINQAIDPMPVSPIRPDADITRLSSDEREIRARIQTMNLRLDAPKQALKEELLLKAPVVGEGGESLQGILKNRVYEGLNQDSIADLTTSSQASVMRTMLRDMQYGQVLAFEAFKNTLNRTKVQAVSMAYNVDDYRNKLRVLEGQLDGIRAVKGQ